jgi:nucleotide-binding universal stress UspA family protein
VETNARRKILVPVDGSDQALEVVRYISSMVDPRKTMVALFYVGSGFPEVFWNLDSNPMYQTQKNDVMEWLADRQLAIGEFKEKALKILDRAGFKFDEISVKTQTTKTVVLKDIIQESYQNYSAIAVGRTGLSRLKDLLIGSMAYKLIAKIKHIPTIVIGGQPTSKKVLIALDESIEAMRGVSAVAAMAADVQDMEIAICHCLCTDAISQSYERSSVSPEQEAEWRRYHQDKFSPYLDEAESRLIEAGLNPAKISRQFLFTKSNPLQKVIEVAVTDKVGTIIVGRREYAGFVDEHFRGRFSEKLISSLTNIAVWVSS